MEITLLRAALWSLALSIGYLFGSILFAKIVVRAFTGKNIEDIGDKNPGVKNATMHVGFRAGAITAVLDVLKIYGPILTAFYVFKMDYFFVFFMSLGAVIGHLHPLYFGFRGGKGAAVAIGSFLFFIPYEVIGAAAILLISYLVKKFLIRKRGFLFSVRQILVATIIISLFMPHPWTIKIMVLLIILTCLTNGANRQNLKEGFAVLSKKLKRTTA